MSTFLNLPDLPQQAQAPYITFNTKHKPTLQNRLDGVLSKTFVSADITLTADEAVYGTVKCAGSPAAPHALIYPAGGTGERRIWNTSGQTVTVKYATGAAVDVLDGEVKIVLLSGSDVLVAASDAGAIDIDGLTSATPVDGDEAAFHDVSASAPRKVTFTNLWALFLGSIRTFTKAPRFNNLLEVTPSTDQDDYTTAGLTNAVVVKVTPSADVTYTGLQTGAAGRFLWIYNSVTNHTVTLAHESASSAAGNRFYVPGNLVLSDGMLALLWYDDSSSRWRCSHSRILDRAYHTGTQLAATISDLAATVKAYRLDEFAAPTADVAFGGHKITGLAAGVASTDAATVGQVAAASGVTTVAASAPLSSSGGATPTIAFTNQAANTVVAGPTSGGSGAVTARALVAADIPAIAESGVTNLVTDLAAKAPLASPTFTGDPKAPTPAVDDNDTSIATTAFIQGQKGSATPQPNGTGAAGTSTKWAPIDHVHPALPQARAKTGTTVNFSYPGSATGSASTFTIVTNTIYYEPRLLLGPVTLDRIGIEVTTAASAGQVARLAIYNADNDWQPTSLVQDCGTVAIDSTGVKTISITQALPAGSYLFMMHMNGAPVLRRLNGGGSQLLGVDPGMGTAPFVNRLTKATAYAAAANPGTAWDTSTLGSADFNHFILCRFA